MFSNENMQMSALLYTHNVLNNSESIFTDILELLYYINTEGYYYETLNM